MFTRHFKVGERVKTAMLALSLALLLLTCFTFAPPLARAQSIASPDSELQKGLVGIQEPLGAVAVDIRIIIARIIRIALGLLGLVLLGFVLYGGYLWMTAGGNEEQIGTAKRVLTNAVIGLVIILSAYAIVAFVLRLFGIGGQGGGPGVLAPNTQNFQGSGSLGNIIKDHYPNRDQKDVPRNTKIIITFRQPILLDGNLVDDINKNGLYGDCINIGPTMNWKTDCDALKNMDATHINVVRADTGVSIAGANILASFENGKVYTIVIRPYDYLGSASAPAPYVVRLGKDIRLDDPANNNPSAFNKNALGNDYYAWQFTCSTELDTMPPRVNSVLPLAGSVDVKNSVIQIDFSEAMDPIGIQGRFATSASAFIIGNSNIALKSDNSVIPSGSFRLVNGYRTLEFTSDKACGQNACGGTIYCLPVCDKAGENCAVDKNGRKFDAYQMLARAALTFNTSSFESIPFTGLADAASNALDSNPYGQVNPATTTLPIFPNWKQPDNYFWNFTIVDDIDLIAPFIKQISPGLDRQYVGALDPWQILLSKRLRVDPLYDITIDEQPTPEERGDNIPLCKAPRAWFNVDGTTRVSFDHCPFLAGRREYYFPIIPSSVEDAHFNCLYPGLGPGDTGGRVGDHWTTQGGQNLAESLVCSAANPGNCCAVTSTPESRALCCNGLVDAGSASTTASCLAALKADSP